MPAGVPVHVLIAVEGPAEEVALESPGDLHLRWLHHGPAGAAADADLLVDALRDLDFPAGRLHGFVHGEASAVRAVRRHLLAERGVPREALSASGYWKLGRTDEGWREEKPEWNRLVEADVS